MIGQGRQGVRIADTSPLVPVSGPSSYAWLTPLPAPVRSRRKAPVIAGGLATLLFLAGCGGSAASQPPSTVPTPTPSAIAVPTPTADLTATAATAYLAAATTANTAAAAKPHKTLCNSTRIADAKSCWAQDFTITEQFLTAVSAITFPDSMKADVTAFISARTKVAQLASTLSQQADPNADTLDSNAFNAAGIDAGAASGVLRHDLGLPPVPPT